jgi:dihydroorotase
MTANSTIPILFYNASIFYRNKLIKGFLLVDEGRISRIFTESELIPEDIIKLKSSGIDCQGDLLLPGFVDTHVHFRDMEQTYKETIMTGSQAAISGGVTSVFMMPNTKPHLSTPELVKKYQSLCSAPYCNVGINAGINSSFEFSFIAEYKKLGISALKIFPGNRSEKVPLEWGFPFGELYQKIQNQSLDPHSTFAQSTEPAKIALKASYWYRLMVECAKNKIKILIHPELAYDEPKIDQVFNQALHEAQAQGFKNPLLYAHSESHPIETNEFRIVEYLIQLLIDCFPEPSEAPHLHICHVTSPKVVDLVNRAMDEKGLSITIEITPHHMFLNYGSDLYNQHFGKVLTPLRAVSVQEKLFEKVQNNEIFSIATDHAPHSYEEKISDFKTAPSGFPGVDIAAVLLLSKVFSYQFSLENLIRYYSSRPAELFLLKTKGKIEIGYDADLVLVKKVLPYRIQAEKSLSKAKWSPYENLEVCAQIDRVFLMGEEVFNAEKGIIAARGKLLM